MLIGKIKKYLNKQNYFKLHTTHFIFYMIIYVMDRLFSSKKKKKKKKILKKKKKKKKKNL